MIYLSTLSKAIAPSIRIGFVAAAAPVVERLVRLRRMGTRGNDGITQAAVASWIEDGGFERHLRRSRLVYRERRDAAFAAIEEAQRSGCRVSCDLPDGGLALWTRWAALDTWRLARRAREHGVLFAPERLLRVTPRRSSGARFAFSRHTPEELRAAIGIVARLAGTGS